MQMKKRNQRTVVFVTILSLTVLFLIIQCNGQKYVTAGDYQQTDPPVVVGWGSLDLSAIKGFLAENKISIMTFIAEDGRIFISNRDGSEVLPCNYDPKTKKVVYPGECPSLRGRKIDSFSQAATFVVTGSWPCILIKIGGWEFWWDVVNNKPCSP